MSALLRSLAGPKLPVVEDDFESLKNILHRRTQGSRPRPLKMYISTSSCPDCTGPGHENHFGSKVRVWRNENLFHASDPKHADVIVVEGVFPEEKRAEAFTGISDFKPHYKNNLHAHASALALQLLALIEQERGLGRDVHFYTYQH